MERTAQLDRAAAPGEDSGLVSVRLRHGLPGGAARVRPALRPDTDDSALRPRADGHGPELRVLPGFPRGTHAAVSALRSADVAAGGGTAARAAHSLRHTGAGFRLAQLRLG